MVKEDKSTIPNTGIKLEKRDYQGKKLHKLKMHAI